MRSKQVVGVLSAAILALGVVAPSSFAIAGAGPGGGPNMEEPGDANQEAPGDDQSGENGEEGEDAPPPKPKKPPIIDLVIDASDALAESYFNEDESDDIDVDSDWACKKPSFKKKQKKVVVRCYGEIYVTEGEDGDENMYCGTAKVTIKKGKTKPAIRAQWVGKRTKALAPNVTHEDTWCAKYEKYSDQTGFKAEPPTEQGEDAPAGEENAAAEELGTDES